jgi:hypothetical protein
MIVEDSEYFEYFYRMQSHFKKLIQLRGGQSANRPHFTVRVQKFDTKIYEVLQSGSELAFGVSMRTKTKGRDEVSSSHDGKYEHDCLLGCQTV